MNAHTYLTQVIPTLQTHRPDMDAQILLAHVLDCPRSRLIANLHAPLTPPQIESANHTFARLRTGEPLPYILGHWEFFGLDFDMIPRPETELLVEKAIDWLKASPERKTVADVGTGSGLIATCIAMNVPDARILATDISHAALKIAKHNAEKFHVHHNIEFVECDLLPQSSIVNRQSKIDLICANLPYIPTQTLKGLPIFRREPTIALDGGEDGSSAACLTSPPRDSRRAAASCSRSKRRREAKPAPSPSKSFHRLPSPCIKTSPVTTACWKSRSMKTEIVPASAIARALKALKTGGIVALPTDTVYGLGALAFDNAAIESLYKAKDRPLEKAIPILIGDLSDLDKIGFDIPDMALRFASRFWPGPLTCVIPKKPTLPRAVSATSTVAVRIPNHPDALALLRAAGPMAVTSANISGAQNPTSAREVYDQLNGRIPLILDGGETPGGIPSTLVDCAGAQPVILREGPITLENLISALR
ncbi:MAG: threonylcarbamoyl-AMP synthase [Anaerolineales bacterium]|nr:threonylcarbamoyl-AMP synthase [Anaerolineales bacterium]